MISETLTSDFRAVGRLLRLIKHQRDGLLRNSKYQADAPSL